MRACGLCMCLNVFVLFSCACMSSTIGVRLSKIVVSLRMLCVWCSYVLGWFMYVCVRVVYEVSMICACLVSELCRRCYL